MAQPWHLQAEPTYSGHLAAKRSAEAKAGAAAASAAASPASGGAPAAGGGGGAGAPDVFEGLEDEESGGGGVRGLVDLTRVGGDAELSLVRGLLLDVRASLVEPSRRGGAWASAGC